MVELLPDKKRVERFTFDEVCQFNATKAEIEKSKKSRKWKNNLLYCPYSFYGVFIRARLIILKLVTFGPLKMIRLGIKLLGFSRQLIF